MPLYILCCIVMVMWECAMPKIKTHKVAIRESVDSLCMDDADMHTHILSFRDSLPSFWSKIPKIHLYFQVSVAKVQLESFC